MGRCSGFYGGCAPCGIPCGGSQFSNAEAGWNNGFNNASVNDAYAANCNNTAGKRRTVYYEDEQCFNSNNNAVCANSNRDCCNGFNAGCNANAAGCNNGWGGCGPIGWGGCGGFIGGGCGIGAGCGPVGGCGVPAVGGCGGGWGNDFDRRSAPADRVNRDIGHGNRAGRR